MFCSTHRSGRGLAGFLCTIIRGRATAVTGSKANFEYPNLTNSQKAEFIKYFVFGVSCLVKDIGLDIKVLDC
jgi:hypothetical protein